MWPFSPQTRSWNFATGRSKPRARHGPAMVCLANQKREALTQPFHKRHLRFDAASAVVSTPSLTRQALPKDAAQSDRHSARPRYFSAPQRLIVCGPCQGLGRRGGRFAHALPLSRWIDKIDPSRFCAPQPRLTAALAGFKAAPIRMPLSLPTRLRLRRPHWSKTMSMWSFSSTAVSGLSSPFTQACFARMNSPSGPRPITVLTASSMMERRGSSSTMPMEPENPRRRLFLSCPRMTPTPQTTFMSSDARALAC